MLLFRLLAFAMIVANLGCANVMRVRKATSARDAAKVETAKLPGIPFYGKVQRFKQSTVYHEPRYVVTLKIHTTTLDSITAGLREVLANEDEKDTSDEEAVNWATGVKSLRLEMKEATSAFRYEFNLKIREQLPELRSMVFSVASGDEASAVIDKLNDLSTQDAYTDPVDPAHPTSNTIISIVAVDYEQVYFMNAPQPWFGSATVTTELSGDGTLAKTTAASESSLAEGISSLVPFKEYLSSKYVPPPPSEVVVEGAGAVNFLRAISPAALRTTGSVVLVRAELDIEDKGYLYTFTRIYGRDPCGEGCAPTCRPLDFTRSGQYSRAAVGASKVGSKNAQKPSKTISIDGTIDVPK